MNLSDYVMAAMVWIHQHPITFIGLVILSVFLGTLLGVYVRGVINP